MTWSRTVARLLGPTGKERVGVLAQHLWAAGFSGLSVFLRHRSVEWQNPEPHRRVLVVAPHPDDESIGCAGAVLLHKQAGAQVIVACVTDGRSSRAHGLDSEEMARRRRREADACARLLGIDGLEWLGLPADAWRDEQLLSGLEVVMARHRPDVVYAPSCVDFHPEHRKVAQVLGHFWARSSTRPETVRIYPVQVPLTPVLANLVVDVTGAILQARAAMDAYTTQRANMPRALRQRRYTARCYGLGEYAEEFWQLSAEAYSRLHQEESVHDAVAFRGVREHAMSDPLAYMAGRRARRRLADVVRHGLLTAS